MRNRTSIPDAARRLSRALKTLGYSKESPYRPESPVALTQVIDLPGCLDFAYAEITALWPEKRTVGFSCEGEPDNSLVNSFQEYDNGNYIDAHWTDLESIEDIAERLKDTIGQRKKDPLLYRLAKMLPAEGIALVFSKDDTVRFLDSEGKKETFHILRAWKEEGSPMVRYATPYGEFTDYARDLHCSDIREVIRAIRR